MENDKIICTFQLKKHEIDALDEMAKKMNLSRSVVIRILLFQQLNDENANWIIPVAIARGQAPWVYVNEILQTFRKSVLYSVNKQKRADKKAVIEGS